MSEYNRFLKEGNREAVAIYTGEIPMSQEGFELCIREMIRLECDRIYSEFAGDHREMLECFHAGMDESLGQNRGERLMEEEKENLWVKIQEKCQALEESEKKDRKGGGL